MNVKRSLQRRIIQLLSSRSRSIPNLLQLLQIPKRTLRYHLAILRRSGVLIETTQFSDRRRKIFYAR